MFHVVIYFVLYLFAFVRIVGSKRTGSIRWWPFRSASEPTMPIHCDWWRGRGGEKKKTPSSLDHAKIERTRIWSASRCRRYTCTWRSIRVTISSETRGATKLEMLVFRSTFEAGPNRVISVNQTWAHRNEILLDTNNNRDLGRFASERYPFCFVVAVIEPTDYSEPEPAATSSPALHMHPSYWSDLSFKSARHLCHSDSNPRTHTRTLQAKRAKDVRRCQKARNKRKNHILNQITFVHEICNIENKSET